MTNNQFDKMNKQRERRVQFLKDHGWKQGHWQKWYNPEGKQRKSYRMNDAYKVAKAHSLLSPKP